MRTTPLLTAAAMALGLAACDSAVAPEDAALGSTLDPDGALVPHVLGASVTGSGIISGDADVRAFTLSAREHADGTVRGQYTLVLNGNDRRLAGTRGKIIGDVTCLRVEGGRAWIAGSTKKDELEQFPFPIGGVGIEVVDGGDGPDLISPVAFWPTLAPAEEWCETAGPGPVFQAEHGQIEVRGGASTGSLGSTLDPDGLRAGQGEGGDTSAGLDPVG